MNAAQLTILPAYAQQPAQSGPLKKWQQDEVRKLLSAYKPKIHKKIGAGETLQLGLRMSFYFDDSLLAQPVELINAMLERMNKQFVRYKQDVDALLGCQTKSQWDDWKKRNCIKG